MQKKKIIWLPATWPPELGGGGGRLALHFWNRRLPAESAVGWFRRPAWTCARVCVWPSPWPRNNSTQAAGAEQLLLKVIQLLILTQDSRALSKCFRKSVWKPGCCKRSWGLCHQKPCWVVPAERSLVPSGSGQVLGSAPQPSLTGIIVVFRWFVDTG